MKESDIAIIVFTYSRLDHTKITLEALSKNKGFDKYPVYIFSDGPKEQHREQVLLVRSYLKDFKSKNKNVKVIERKQNMGLEKSIINGVTDGLAKHEAAIVVEDDIRTAPAFLEYMKNMLCYYKNGGGIGCITGYNSPTNLMKIPTSYKYNIYFAPRTCSWGWATWKDKWNNVDWKVKDIDNFITDKKKQKEFNKGGWDLSRMLIAQVKEGIDTWDIQWCYHNFKNNWLTIYPTVSYVENIGQDGTGVHCGKTSGFRNNALNSKSKINNPPKVEINKNMLKIFQKAQIPTLKMYIELIVWKISDVLGFN